MSYECVLEWWFDNIWWPTEMSFVLERVIKWRWWEKEFLDRKHGPFDLGQAGLLGWSAKHNEVREWTGGVSIEWQVDCHLPTRWSVSQNTSHSLQVTLLQPVQWLQLPCLSRQPCLSPSSQPRHWLYHFHQPKCFFFWFQN